MFRRMAGGDHTSFQRLLTAFEQYERENSATNQLQAQPYIQNNEWVVARDYFGQLALYLSMFYDKKIPGLFRTSIWGLFRNALTRKSSWTLFCSGAEAIQMNATGDRLRSFHINGPTHPHTLKIVSHHNADYRSIQREAAVREDLARLDTLKTPRFEAIFEDTDFLYCREELVFGRRFSPRLDRNLFKTDVLPQLTATYNAFGVDWQPLGDFLPSQFIAKVQAALGTEKPSINFVRDLSAIVERNGQVATSLVHGDLVPSNLAISDNGVVFLDWARAGKGVIAFDFLRMARKYSRVGFFIAAIQDALEPHLIASGFGFDCLLTVYIGLSIVENPKAANHYLAFGERYVSSPKLATVGDHDTE